MLRIPPLIKIIPLLVCLLNFWVFNASAADYEGKIIYFDVLGLRLNMNLDKVIKDFNINNLKAIQDEFGIVSEFEIDKEVKMKQLKLRFTSEKRLYRIQYINFYKSFVKRPNDILDQLILKYGEPTIRYQSSDQALSTDIFCCWGNSCEKKTYVPLTPTMTVNISYYTGKVTIVLSDHSIYNDDWKKYKDKRDSTKNMQIDNRNHLGEKIEF